MTAIAFPVSASHRRHAQPRLRITARGRAVLGSLVAVPFVAIALMLGLGATGATATQTTATTTFEYVTVSAGQSLWDIAAEVAPGVDPREFAAQVASLNQLASSVLQPGQRLAIPAQYAD